MAEYAKQRDDILSALFWKRFSTCELVLLKKLSGIVFLHLDGSFLKVFMRTEIPNGFSSVSCTLKHLFFRMVSFDDSVQLLSSLALVRSSPNLQTQRIHAFSYGNDAKAREAVCVRELSTIGIMPHLRNVKMYNLRGLKAEYLFIGTILSSSPLLERLFLEFKVDKWQKLIMLNSIINNLKASHNVLIKMKY